MRTHFCILFHLLIASALGQPKARNGELPVVSPDGHHIAFSSDRGGMDEVYIIRDDGSNEGRLTHALPNDMLVGWSADGTQVIISRRSNDTLHSARVISIALDGSNQKTIAAYSGFGRPSIAPDGSHLLFMKGTWTSMTLMMGDSDGSHERPLTNGSTIAWNDSWSPDGLHIAYTTRNGPQDPLRVFIMNADGSMPHDATDIPPRRGEVQWPRWSPDGRTLAVQVNDHANKSGCIWIAEVSTGKAHRIAPHEQKYNDETPAWFPDGKRIAFQSDRTGRYEVWVMDIDGANQRQVTGIK